MAEGGVRVEGEHYWGELHNTAARVTLVTHPPPTQGGGGKEFKVETGMRRRPSLAPRVSLALLSRASRASLSRPLSRCSPRSRRSS